MYIKLYIKYISLSLMVIMSVFIVQVNFVLQSFEPYYVTMPIFGSIAIGVLLTHISIKNLEFFALKNKVYTDPLTNLQNRLSLNSDIETTNPQALFIIDISSFATLNDLYGEFVGDIILKELAIFLEAHADDSCKVYRYMGDQFAFLSQKNRSEEDYKSYMFELLKTIETQLITITVDDKELELNISIIVGGATKNATDSILEKADMALNYAKREKESAVLYSKDLQIEARYALDLSQTELVKNALRNDLIIPVFQPIVKADETSYECLVRIKDGDKLIPPSEFLTAIKKTRYYSELTKVMIQKSFAHFAPIKDVSFSINLSFEDITNAEVNAYLFEMIDAYNIGNRLIIEIVESESIENFTIVKAFIKTIRGFGTRIAIDDFGSGYSNFAYLLEMRPDFIKIDGSIIKDIGTCEDSFRLTKLIHEASKAMNIETIAEFIHNEEVHEKAKGLGIDAFQGYFLGKPKKNYH